MAVECGFELLGVEDDFVEDLSEEIGFDYLSLLSGGAGMLQGAGGLMSGGGGTAAKPDAATVALQAQKDAAEKSAANMKIGMIILAVLLGLIGVVALARGGASPAPVAR